MKTKLIAAGTLGLAGLVGAGVLSFPASTAATNGGDEAVTKREDGVGELVLVDDDDDDDDDTLDESKNTRTGADQTRSRASRDRDASKVAGQNKQDREISNDLSRAGRDDASRDLQSRASRNDVSRDSGSRDGDSRDRSGDESRG